MKSMEALREKPFTLSGEDLHEPVPGFLFMDTLDRGVAGYACGWVVKGRRNSILVETGAGAAVPMWLSALDRAGISHESIEWILLTHVHLDHAGGAGELLRHLPNARIGIHPDGIRHLIDPQRLVSQAKAVWKDDFALLGSMLPAPADRIVPLADGDLIDLDGVRRFRVIHTPGHTPHHAVFFEETTRGVFSGDALGAFFSASKPGLFSTVPGISPPLGDIPEYLSSIARIAELRPQCIYAAHFGLWEPAHSFIHIAAGQVALLWKLCREVRRSGGTLKEVQCRAAGILAGSPPGRLPQAELERSSLAMAEAAWNFVIRRETRNDLALPSRR